MGPAARNGSASRKLTEALRSLSPEPSPRLYRLLRDAPWVEVAGDTGPRSRQIEGEWRRARKGLGVVPVIAGILVLVAIAGALVFYGEALAQGLETFFRRAAERVILIDRGDANVVGIATGLSVEEAEEVAGFELLLPAEVPPPFAFQDATYDPAIASVTLNYSSAGRILWIVEQQAPFTTEKHPTSLIGPNAEVEAVEVGGSAGELVTGSWLMTGGDNDAELRGEWTADVPAKVLRWQAGAYFLEIFVAGGSPGHPGYMSNEDLISFAETLR